MMGHGIARRFITYALRVFFFLKSQFLGGGEEIKSFSREEGASQKKKVHPYILSLIHI